MFTFKTKKIAENNNKIGGKSSKKLVDLAFYNSVIMTYILLNKL